MHSNIDPWKKISKPNFFIVGFPRSGTTSMYNYLSQHHEIFLSEIKEPHFFSQSTSYRNSIKVKHYSEAEYSKLFKNAQGQKIIGEGSTNYIFDAESINSIHEFNPHSKILVMLRNPVDFLYAFHFASILSRREKNTDFTQVIYAQLNNSKDVEYSHHYLDLLFQAQKNIALAQKLFGYTNVKIVVLENFLIHTKKYFSEILEFLEVDTSLQIKEFVQLNSYAGHTKYMDSRLMFILSHANTMCRKVGISRRIRDFLNREITRLLSRKAYRPDLDESTKKQILSELASYIDTMEDISGESLMIWRD